MHFSPRPSRRVQGFSSALFLVGASRLEALRSDEALPSATYRVTHSLVVKDIPEGARRVRVWFWLPDDDEAQKVLDLQIREAPPGTAVTRDPANGHRYLYAEVGDPNGSAVSIKTEFLIRRSRIYVPVDPRRAGALTDAHRAAFSEYLRTDVPEMEVDGRIRDLAGRICGTESNLVVEMRRLIDWVVDNSDHYSKPGAPPSSQKGSASYCLDQKGGACTDQHSLLVSLARARGIPTRLEFGSRLVPEKEGKDLDPGYRCWVLYFVPGYGWVPTDVSAADTNPDKRDFYASGLDERRIRFLEGRDLDLEPKQEGPRLNLMIAAYAEVDGKPHAAFDRRLRFVEVKPGQAESEAPPEK